MRNLALAAALTLAPALPALAEPIPGSDFATGYWAGAAHTENGAYSHCDVSVSYTNGEVLWLGLYPDDTISILLSHPEVRFQPGEQFNVWMMLETGLPWTGTGEAWDEDYAGITFREIGATSDFLASGQWLRLLGIGIDEAYDVTGIGDALAMAQACNAKYSGSNPFAKVVPPAEEPADVAPPAEQPPAAQPQPPTDTATPALGTPMPKVPDLKPKTGGGLGSRPGGTLGTPAPKPAP